MRIETRINIQIQGKICQNIETLYVVYLDILKNMSLQNFVTSFHYNFYFYIILRTIESIKKNLNFNIDLYLICFTLKAHKDFY